MYYWFSTYTGNKWKPKDGYNGTFRDQVVLLREWFRLRKAGTGREEGTGAWLEYKLQHETCYITVDSLTWSDYRTCPSSYRNEKDADYYNDYITPTFKLNVKLARERYSGKKEVFFEETLVIEFSPKYPSSPPVFSISSGKYPSLSNIAPYEHHMMQSKILCIMAGRTDWNPDKDTIVRAVNAAFDWIVWHYNKFGW